MILLLLLIPTVSVVSSDSSLTSKREPIRFWRADPHLYKISESHIFPMGSLGVDGTLNNLGQAWITWTLDVDGWKIPAFAIFNRGKVTNFTISDGFFREVYWEAFQTRLFLVTSSDTETKLNLYELGTYPLTTTLSYSSTSHQIYITPNQIQLFLMKNGTNPTNLFLKSFSIFEEESDYIIFSTFPGSAILQNKLSDTLILDTSGTQVSLPEDFTNHSELGHVMMEPGVFDLTSKQLFINGSVIPLPESAVDFYPWGMGSSILRTTDNILYEYRVFQWVVVDTLNSFYDLLDYSIIDIELYLGILPKDGLQLVTSGADEDGDQAPDTLESYFGSYPYTDNSDGDQIPDNIEIAYGLDPLYDDDEVDADGDSITNIDEINLGTDPNNADSDFGGAIDGWEVDFKYNPLDRKDDLLDPDGDGATNAEESRYGSSPHDQDTDKDGIPDMWEIQYKLDPTDAEDADEDPDQDNRDNLFEYEHGMDPLLYDPLPLFYGLNPFILLILLPSYLLVRRIDTRFIDQD